MILVTGGNGFLGGHLIKTLEGKNVVSLARGKFSQSTFRHHCLVLNSNTDFKGVFESVHTIVHCAGRVHIMNDLSANPFEDYLEANTSTTLNIATKAFESGVKRFIFISSIKVNGESTELNKPFNSNDIRSPVDFYGKSKSKAEEQLFQLAKETGLEVVIIRPTLIYGPGVKANFASLLNLVSKGIPLPFGCITQNKRSLVSVANLVDLIITCIDHPNAANQVFLVSDDHDVSTSEMVREMAKALGKPTWQLPIPIWCYKFVGKLCNKSDVVDRLTGSLQVDISHTKDTLGWEPPQSLQEGFKQTAQAFLQAKNK
ncbi:UDP-glucose 4-epimerase family protein [Shewanella algae]|uniref:Cholesterol dehydrogenase n=1 Tax=Shewanella algae TaxID=38313 RepID=A0A379YGX5_9GAMM|nr:SDR family oxidoreductase [Shewanella algae]MBO2607087.1 SDR family oxidoreductase [Shewanella algae]SUI45024.1 Cholesterol dehydrogenase [Shewanella algae]